MAIYLEALSGPYQGESFLVKETYEIGRAKGEILLRNDAKVSSSHAVVKKDKRGNLTLVDLKSANGIKVHGQKVKKVVLLPGMTFEIGRTLFKVTERASDADLPEVPQEIPWVLTLRSEIPKLVTLKGEQDHGIAVFSPPMKVKIIQGIQADQSFILGYGPREFGSETLDFELEETTAPPIAFELVPLPRGAEFRTRHPKLVLLNDQPVSQKELKEGDQIRLGQTIIEIGFVK